MRFLKVSTYILLFVVSHDFINGQCILGTQNPCQQSESTYLLNYQPGNGDSVLSASWVVDPPKGSIVRSNKDSLIYTWTGAGSTMLYVTLITSGGDTTNCFIGIMIIAIDSLQIHSDNSGNCNIPDQPTYDFNFCEGDSTNFYTEYHGEFHYKWKLNDTSLLIMIKDC